MLCFVKLIDPLKPVLHLGGDILRYFSLPRLHFLPVFLKGGIDLLHQFGIILLELPNGEHDLMGPGELDQVLAAASSFLAERKPLSNP